jgi:Acetyltransferase (GNAT) domain
LKVYPGWRAMAKAMVADDFEVPTELSTTAFRLEPLGEQHNDGDFAAWMSSIAHIRSTPGFVGWSWPPSAGMSLEDNLRSVRRHAVHFAARVGFPYAVLERGTDAVIGCVYLYPVPDGGHDCEVRSWVRADRAELDGSLHEAVLEWLDVAWPFRAVLSHPRG